MCFVSNRCLGSIETVVGILEGGLGLFQSFRAAYPTLFILYVCRHIGSRRARQVCLSLSPFSWTKPLLMRLYYREGGIGARGWRGSFLSCNNSSSVWLSSYDVRHLECSTFKILLAHSIGSSFPFHLNNPTANLHVRLRTPMPVILRLIYAILWCTVNLPYCNMSAKQKG